MNLSGHRCPPPPPPDGVCLAIADGESGTQLFRETKPAGKTTPLCSQCSAREKRFREDGNYKLLKWKEIEVENFLEFRVTQNHRLR
jgi:hypothetical protein